MISTKSQNVIKKPMVSTKISKTTLPYRQKRLELPKITKKTKLQYRKKQIICLFHSKSIHFEFFIPAKYHKFQFNVQPARTQAVRTFHFVFHIRFCWFRHFQCAVVQTKITVDFFFHFFAVKKKIKKDTYLPTYFLGNRPKSILLP